MTMIVPLFSIIFQSTPLISLSFFFFFNDTATTEIYTLSLHDALPIYQPATSSRRRRADRYHPAGRPEDAASGEDLGLLLVHGRGRGGDGRPHASPSARAHRLTRQRGRPRAGPSCFSAYPLFKSGSWPRGRLPGPPAGSNLQGSWRP